MTRAGKWLRSLGLALLATALAAGAGAAQGTLKIGYVGDFTGNCADLSASNFKGAELAAKEINAAGGILGRTVELLPRDGKTLPDEGVAQARRLILQDRVSFLLGPCSSASALAITELARQFRVILITSVANTHRATEVFGHPYYFQVVPNTRMEGRAAAIAASGKPWKRWVTMSLDYEWGHVLTDSFIQALKSRRPDVEVVKQYWPKLGETDFSAFITSILADRPDAVFSGNFGQSQIAFVRQAGPLGLFRNVNVLTLMSVDTLKSLGDALPEGQLMWSRAPFFGIDNPTMSRFVSAFRQAYGDYPDDWATMGYDAMHLLAQGIRAAGTLDPAQVSSALRGLTFNGVRGAFTVRALDGMASVPVFVGTTAADPRYPFRIFRDVQVVPGDQIWATPEEVEAARKAAR